MEKLLDLVDIKKCNYQKLNKVIVISENEKYEFKNVIVITNNREEEYICYNGTVKKKLKNHLSTKYTFYFFSTIELNNDIILEFNNLKIEAIIESDGLVADQNKGFYFKYKYSGYIKKEESF